MPASYPVKGMTVPETLDTTVRLLRDHFKSLFLVTLFVAFPLNLISGTMTYFVEGDEDLFSLFSDEEEFEEEDGAEIGAEIDDSYVAADPRLETASWVLELLDILVVGPLTYGALVMMGAAVYLGKSMTPWGAFKYVLSRLLDVGLAQLGYTLLVLVGLVLLIAPGIYFALRYFAVMEALLYENTTVDRAFTRAAELIEGRMGDAFILMLLSSIIMVILYFSTLLLPFWPLRVFCTALVDCVVLMFTATLCMVFYFSCRCKRENFDVQFYAMETVDDGGAPPANDPHTAPRI